MILIEGIMHRKVKWWITLIIVTILVVISAFAIVAKAANTWILGGEVVKYIPACIAVTESPACPGAYIPCPCAGVCGCTWGVCILPQAIPPVWSQIILRPTGRAMSYSCPVIGFKYSGSAPPSPKKKILGYGLNAYKPFRIGLGR